MRPATSLPIQIPSDEQLTTASNLGLAVLAQPTHMTNVSKEVVVKDELGEPTLGQHPDKGDSGRAVRVCKTRSAALSFTLMLCAEAGDTAADGTTRCVLLTENEAIALMLELADANGLQLVFFDFLNPGKGDDDPSQPMEERIARARGCSSNRIAERANEIGELELLRRILGPDAKIPHQLPGRSLPSDGDEGEPLTAFS